MKKDYNMKSVLIIAIALLSMSAYGQKDTYEIVSNNKVSNVSNYEKAMNKANFDSYRFVNTRRRITFESGVIVELLSVNELKSKGVGVDETKAIKEKLPANYKEPIYKITDKGHIVAQYPTVSKPNKQ